MKLYGGCKRPALKTSAGGGNPEDLSIVFRLQPTVSAPKTPFSKIYQLCSEHTYVSTQIPSHIGMWRHPLVGKQVTICK